MTPAQEDRFEYLLETYVNGNISHAKQEVLNMDMKTIGLFLKYLNTLANESSGWGEHADALRDKIATWISE